MEPKTPTHDFLTWEERRWHCLGTPIHAGAMMELGTGGEEWLTVRIESRDAGRQLVAHYSAAGLQFERVVQQYDELRWPDVRPAWRSRASV